MGLAFDERQLLLPGVHEVSLETVKEHFARFQRSDRRLQQFVKLSEYLKELKKAQCGESVILDGSFVMACVDEPEDIDLLLVLPVDWDDAADLKPYQYNLVSKRVVRKNYQFDLFVVKAGSADEAEWIEFFGGVSGKWREKFGWPEDVRKGILRVPL
jgi:hypothetical protein